MKNKNCLLYDWLTVSFVNVTADTLLQVLGLAGLNWQEQKTGSRLKYGHRMSYDGISVHYTDDWDLKHNVGICLEMSGQGCRDFETFGTGDWFALFDFIALTGAHVSRIDIAFDDFTGVIPLRIMAEQARRFYFTARTQRVRIMEESDDGNPNHVGVSVCHGSKSSEVYIRCYDKRAERHAFEEYEHWVRLELQLRNSNAVGFVNAAGCLGPRFRGVLANYLNYRCPDTDSNKRRWYVCPWWSKFLDDAEAISVHEKKDCEYNKDRLDKHIYDRNHNSIKAEILVDGLPAFLEKVFGHQAEMPLKYQSIMNAAKNADDILDILSKTTSTMQLQEVCAGIEGYKDFHGFN